MFIFKTQLFNNINTNISKRETANIPELNPVRFLDAYHGDIILTIHAFNCHPPSEHTNPHTHTYNTQKPPITSTLNITLTGIHMRTHTRAHLLTVSRFYIHCSHVRVPALRIQYTHAHTHTDQFTYVACVMRVRWKMSEGKTQSASISSTLGGRRGGACAKAPVLRCAALCECVCVTVRTP